MQTDTVFMHISIKLVQRIDTVRSPTGIKF